MQTRKIPSTGEPLPVVGCGTWQTFDVGPSAAERAPRAEVLKVLFEAGGSVIDSSPMYGRSEAVVGDCWPQPARATRPSSRPRCGPAGRRQASRRWRSRCTLLRTDKHRADADPQPGRLADPPADAQGVEGRGPHPLMGITHYTESSARRAGGVLRRGGSTSCRSTTRWMTAASSALLRSCQNNGVAVLINQPFGGGGLLRKLSAAQAARLGRRDRLHELGADPAEVRARPAGRDLRHPRHRQARAHARQRAGRARAPIPTTGCGNG